MSDLLEAVVAGVALYYLIPCICAAGVFVLVLVANIFTN
jgi:hypothetical protein